MTAAGADGSGSPTSPSSGTGRAGRPIWSPKSCVAREPSAAQSAALTSANDASHDLEGLGARHAAAADELDGDARALHLERDLLARAVHDDDVVVGRELEHRLRRLRGHRAAELDDEQRHER